MRRESEVIAVLLIRKARRWSWGLFNIQERHLVRGGSAQLERRWRGRSFGPPRRPHPAPGRRKEKEIDVVGEMVDESCGPPKTEESR